MMDGDELPFGARLDTALRAVPDGSALLGHLKYAQRQELKASDQVTTLDRVAPARGALREYLLTLSPEELAIFLIGVRNGLDRGRVQGYFFGAIFS